MPQSDDQMPTLVTLINFDKSGGWDPNSGGLIIDAQGDLFGTTDFYGTNNIGIAYELKKTANGYAATFTTVANLNAVPDGSVEVIDKSGNLFDSAPAGGSATLFEIAKTGGSYASTLTAFGNFDSIDGMYPEISLVDAKGDLFGTTSADGAESGGAIFEIVKTANGYASTPTELADFGGSNGSEPGGLFADSAGDLFGTTQNGGAYGAGELYELAKTAKGYTGTVTVLASFKTEHVGGSLTEDANGNLFGVSELDGSIYELAKTANGYASTLTVLANFAGLPYGTLVIDANGDLFGTSTFGGPNNDGEVFEIAKTAGGYAQTPTVLADFNGTNGDAVAPNLVVNAAGDLFGITGQGGSSGEGTLFEITNSGFVTPLCLVQGSRLAVPGGEAAVEDLRPGDAVTTPVGAVPVRWVGRRHYQGRFINNNPLALPVTIKAGALANGVPAQDLQVSPGHGIWLEGVLIPAWRLVNGVSVTQAAAVESVAYYNVELAGHGLLFAQGAAVESFLDDGAFRNQFENAAEYWALYPDAPLCRDVRPLPRLESGFRLDAIQHQVNRRAGIVPADAGPLRGYVDTAGAGGWVHGWAQDVAHPEAAVSLRIFAHGQRLARVIANAYRADLREAGLGSGCHAFSCRVPPGLAGAIEVRRETDHARLPWADGARKRAA